jgi:hypothetical protein
VRAFIVLEDELLACLSASILHCVFLFKRRDETTEGAWLKKWSTFMSSVEKVSYVPNR